MASQPAGVCQYYLALIKPKRDKVDPIYLSKQLGSKQSAIYFSRLANGSTRYGLSSSAIASIKIPLAPFVEQRRIADVLSTLDKAIEKTEALIAKYQQIKAGLMHDLFTRGVTADGKLRPPRESVKTKYGWLPREWRIGSLLEASDPARQG
jgi:type I restriction enzyme S subunit